MLGTHSTMSLVSIAPPLSQASSNKSIPDSVGKGWVSYLLYCILGTYGHLLLSPEREKTLSLLRDSLLE